MALGLALALAAAACGGSDGQGSAGGSGGEPTTTEAAGASGSSTEGTDGSDGGSDAGASAGGSISDAETAPLTLDSLEPNRLGAPLPGRYFYDVAGDDSPIELSVFDLLDGQDADDFDRTGNLGQLHIEKEGSEARAGLIRWAGAEVTLDAEQRAQNTTSGLNEGSVCDFEPDLLLQPSGTPTVGATWEDESTCTAEDGDVTVTRQRTVRGEVMASSTAQVGGRTVETVRLRRVIDTTTTSDTEPPLVLTEHREVTIDWIVAAGLAARVEGTIVETVSGAPQPPRIFTWTLQSTEPIE